MSQVDTQCIWLRRDFVIHHRIKGVVCVWTAVNSDSSGINQFAAQWPLAIVLMIIYFVCNRRAACETSTFFPHSDPAAIAHHLRQTKEPSNIVAREIFLVDSFNSISVWFNSNESARAHYCTRQMGMLRACGAHESKSAPLPSHETEQKRWKMWTIGSVMRSAAHCMFDALECYCWSWYTTECLLNHN